MSARARPSIHAVVLAGGAGTRFWPLSRRARPKPLLRVGSGSTLLGATFDRARRFADEDRLWLVCGAEHSRAVRKESGLRPARVLVEPQMRNTAAAVTLAAARILREDPDGVMAILPADHIVPDTRAFATAIRRGAAAAEATRGLVTLGVRPTRAETGYGYIRLGKPLGSAHPGLHHVTRFVEKPDRARARRYWRSGRYLWNAGVFVWRADVILEEALAHAPEVASELAQLRGVPRPRLSAAIERAYDRIASLPIDQAVLERSDRVRCLPVDFHWSDVGSWGSLAEEVGVTANVTKIIEGEAWLRDARGNLVYGGDRPVALVGVSGLAVVDAGDALLIADLEHSSEVREVVAALTKKGRGELL
ncbi:MAG: sugar phosphate nucleotidyltransferase [Myxococcota bacterium]|nr:sugar phosphate nucleotidyltransferase [Myxococcota bacterium]